MHLIGSILIFIWLCGVPATAGTSFSSANAEEFALGEVSEVDSGTARLGGLSISPDDSLFLYWKDEGDAVESQNYLVIRSMKSGLLEKKMRIAGPVQESTWAPDGRRVALCNEGHLSIVDLSADTVVDLPSRLGFCGSRIKWHKENLISYKPYDNQPPRSLSLTNLKSAEMNLAQFEALFDPMSRSSHINAYLVDCSGVCVQSRAGDYQRRLFTLGRTDGSEFHASRDQKTFVAISYHPFKDLKTKRVWLGTISLRPPPQLRFTATPNEAAEFLSFGEMKSWLDQGMAIRASVWAPTVNPLNGLIVGASGRDPKAVVRVESVGASSVNVRVIKELYPDVSVQEGDVVKGFVSERNDGRDFYRSKDHEWLVLRAAQETTSSHETNHSEEQADLAHETNHSEEQVDLTRTENQGTAGVALQDISVDNARPCKKAPSILPSGTVIAFGEGYDWTAKNLKKGQVQVHFLVEGVKRVRCGWIDEAKLATFHYPCDPPQKIPLTDEMVICSPFANDGLFSAVKWDNRTLLAAEEVASREGLELLLQILAN